MIFVAKNFQINQRKIARYEEKKQLLKTVMRNVQHEAILTFLLKSSCFCIYTISSVKHVFKYFHTQDKTRNAFTWILTCLHLRMAHCIVLLYPQLWVHLSHEQKYIRATIVIQRGTLLEQMASQSLWRWLTKLIILSNDL